MVPFGRNSLTSSQSNSAFAHAFPSFRTSQAWKSVAEYLFGHNYRDHFNLNQRNRGDSSTDEQSAENECSLENFIELYIPDEEEDDDSNAAAYNFIQDYGLENKIEEDQENAEAVATDLSRTTLEEVVKILTSRVPPEKQKKIATERAMQKEVEKWLQSTNKRREFFLFN